MAICVSISASTSLRADGSCPRSGRDSFDGGGGEYARGNSAPQPAHAVHRPGVAALVQPPAHPEEQSQIADHAGYRSNGYGSGHVHISRRRVMATRPAMPPLTIPNAEDFPFNQLANSYVRAPAAADVRELAIHHRVSRLRYSLLCVEASAVQPIYRI